MYDHSPASPEEESLGQGGYEGAIYAQANLGHSSEMVCGIIPTIRSLSRVGRRRVRRVRPAYSVVPDADGHLHVACGLLVGGAVGDAAR